jgi:hypothetical protein
MGRFRKMGFITRHLFALISQNGRSDMQFSASYLCNFSDEVWDEGRRSA